MSIELEDLGNGAVKPARFAGKYRGARRENLSREELARETLPTGTDTGEGVGEPAGLELVGTSDLPPAPSSTPSFDLGGLTEPAAFPTSGWSSGPIESLVEHPLLRGLLLELPPRGTAPSAEWLDRWFEAARSILELLYVQEASWPR